MDEYNFPNGFLNSDLPSSLRINTLSNPQSIFSR